MTDRPTSRPVWPLDPQAPLPPAPARLQIDLSIDHDRLARVTELLVDMRSRVIRIEARLVAQGVQDMATQADLQAKLDALHASVESETDVVTSVETLLTGQTQQLAALRDQLAQAIANGADPAALQAVVDQLDAIQSLSVANRDREIAAVVANTPAAPAAPASPAA